MMKNEVKTTMEEPRTQMLTMPTDSKDMWSMMTFLVNKVNSMDALLRKALSSGYAKSMQSVSSVFTKDSLPNFVSHKVRANATASQLFIDTLKRGGQHIGRNMTRKEKDDPILQQYDGWRWHHLYHALVNLKIIDEKTSHVDFSKFIEQVLPDRKCNNVRRGFYRTYDKDPNIISDMMDTFRPVAEICHL